MNQEDQIKALGKEIRRLSSITDYMTDCKIQLGKINRDLSDDVYRLKGKIREMQSKIESYRENLEAMIRWERMMKEENDNYPKQN